MKIFLGSDHAGVALKGEVAKYLLERGGEVVDLGPADERSVDYPDYAHQLAGRVASGEGVGVLICGSGVGMSMAANRHAGVRAALCCSAELARLSREHNDANVLCLGARVLRISEALAIVEAFFNADFSAGRHTVRVEKIELP